MSAPAARGRRAAVVIGGGIAGLAAARVLAERFSSVTVIERDPLDGDGLRRGVPQARHQHLLLAGGARALEGLFPGLHDELVDGGASLLDAGWDIGWLTPAGWAPRVRSGLVVPACSRELLESRLRRRVAALAGVTFLVGHEAAGLVTDPSGSRVVGARVRPRPGRAAPDSGERVLDCELVVDAGGRGSQAPRWLAALGCAPPEETVISARLGYASRLYQGRATLPFGLAGAIVRAAPPAGRRGGVVMPVEAGRTLVTLVGLGGDHPPTDPDGFTAFARSLRDPLLDEAVRDAEPLGDIAGSRATQNRLRHYERLDLLPEGLVVLGDAACAFNPIFQQGMALAVLGAVLLGDCLRAPGPMSRRFQRKLAALNAGPWALATATDLRVPGVVGPRPGLPARIAQRYVRRVALLAGVDASARRSYLEVLNLVRPARALLRPGLAAAALRHAPAPGGSSASGEQPAVALHRSQSRPERTTSPGASRDEQIVRAAPRAHDRGQGGRAGPARGSAGAERAGGLRPPACG